MLIPPFFCADERIATIGRIKYAMRIIALLFFLVFEIPCFGEERPEAAWLIHPNLMDGFAVEIWASTTSSSGFIWRLIKMPGVVLAEMDEPVAPKGYSYNQGWCKIDGEWRDDVIALVKHSEERQYSSAILEIWVAKPQDKVFSVLHPKAAECMNEGFGI